MSMEEYININKIDEIKGLTSKRSLRLAIQKGKYIAREEKVIGGTFTALAMGLWRLRGFRVLLPGYKYSKQNLSCP